jgi:hypothetical protein
MTIREAITAQVEPYSLSENAIEKAAIDSFYRFDGNTVDVEDDYTPEMEKECGFAAMLCLAQLIPLANENIGGISQSYNAKELEKLIRGIAAHIGVNADMVLGEDDNTIEYKSVW